MEADEPTQAVPPPIDYAAPLRNRRRWRLFLFAGVALIVFLLAINEGMRMFSRRIYESPSRLRCVSNMKQIGQAFYFYCNENGGLYPPDQAAALATQDLVPAVFICPGSQSSTVSTTLFTSDPAARAAKNLDYIYVGEGMKNDVRAEEPILFERLADHDHDGGNVLFGDGHVEFFSKPQILKLLEPLRGTPRLTDEEFNAIVAK